MTENVVHMHNGIFFSIKKGQNPAIGGNVDRNGDHYSIRNKQDPERQGLHNLTHMWNLNTLVLQK
jgi:hypothetical protein